MKKLFSKIMVLLVLCVLTMSACSTANKNVSESVTKEASTASTEAATTQKETKYKDTLLPFDQLVQGKKLLLLQNTLIYSRDGFYTENTAPKTEVVNYNGSEVSAYKMSDVTKMLLNGVNADVKVITTDGNMLSVTKDTFNNCYIILGNLEEGNNPILYNQSGNYEIKDFKYAVTSDNEVIYSIVSEEEKNISELLREVSWDENKTYRLMATDYFYVPVDPAVAKTGMLIGTLSGAINANLPDIKVMKNGKINDIMYIEELTNVEVSSS